MFGFLFKKWFFDMWDNLLRLALVNIGFIAVLAFILLLPSVVGVVPGLGLACMVIGVLFMGVYLQATALSVKTISDYGSFGFKDFFQNLKTGLKPGLLLGILIALLVIPVSGLALGSSMTVSLSVVGMIFYFYVGMHSIVGVIVAAVLFWIFLLCLLSLQWYPSVRARLADKFRPIFRKSFLVFFDNTGFSVAVFITSLIFSVISVFLAFLLPGPASVLLFSDEAMRLRLLKYDYLEAHPDEAHKVNARGRHVKAKIPWDVLLMDERERTGTRTLRNFIFPWKD